MRVISLIVLVAAALTAAPVALGHARLVRTVPANGAVLSEAPREVRVVFDDDVHALSGSQAVRNGGGSVLAAPARTAARDDRQLLLPLRPGLIRPMLWQLIDHGRGRTTVGGGNGRLGQPPIAWPAPVGLSLMLSGSPCMTWFAQYLVPPTDLHGSRTSQPAL